MNEITATLQHLSELTDKEADLLNQLMPPAPDFELENEVLSPIITEVQSGVGYRDTNGWYVYEATGCHHHPSELQANPESREFHRRCLATGKSNYQTNVPPISSFEWVGTRPWKPT